MEGAGTVPGGDPAAAGVPRPEPPQVPAEEPRQERPERIPAAEKPPSPLPARLRLLPPNLGYGAFRRPASTGRELPSPGPAAAAAERPREGEAPGAESPPWAAPGEPAPAAWAPVELQVDVRVKPVGPAGGGHAPSPAPSTRCLALPVPESPAPSRHACPAHPLLQRAASTGSTWGRGAEPGLEAEGRPGPGRGRAEPPGAPRCRCRCPEHEQGPEEAARPRRARGDGEHKLHRALKLIGLPMYMKSLRWALAIMAVFLAVSTVTIVALASTAGARCRPCPQGWLWSGEHCYYLSADAQAWEASRAFCSAQHATLPLLIHTQDFLTRYPVTKYSWVGARRGPQGWHWIDGAPLPAQLLPEEAEDQPHLECGGLEGGKLVALDCASSRPWACAKGTK